MSIGNRGFILNFEEVSRTQCFLQILSSQVRVAQTIPLFCDARKMYIFEIFI